MDQLLFSLIKHKKLNADVFCLFFLILEKYWVSLTSVSFTVLIIFLIISYKLKYKYDLRLETFIK
jgi:hypothetical protein